MNESMKTVTANDESSRDALRQQVFVLLSRVTGVSPGGNNIDANTEFPETGMSSIEYLEFIEKVETSFDVVIDLEAEGSLTTVDKFVTVLLKQGVSV